MQKQWKVAEECFVRVSGPERDKLNFNLMLLKCCQWNLYELPLRLSISDVRNKKLEKAWSIVEKPFSPQEKHTLVTYLANEAYAVMN